MTLKEEITILIREDHWHNIPTKNTVDKIFNILQIKENNKLKR